MSSSETSKPPEKRSIPEFQPTIKLIWKTLITSDKRNMSLKKKPMILKINSKMLPVMLSEAHQPFHKNMVLIMSSSKTKRNSSEVSRMLLTLKPKTLENMSTSEWNVKLSLINKEPKFKLNLVAASTKLLKISVTWKDLFIVLTLLMPQTCNKCKVFFHQPNKPRKLNSRTISMSSSVSFNPLEKRCNSVVKPTKTQKKPTES